MLELDTLPATPPPPPRDPRRGVWGIPYGWWIVICMVYVISPLDLMPELLLGPLGIPDDIGMFGFGVYNFVQWIRARRLKP